MTDEEQEGTMYDAPNQQAVGLAPPWEEGEGGAGRRPAGPAARPRAAAARPAAAQPEPDPEPEPQPAKAKAKKDG